MEDRPGDGGDGASGGILPARSDLLAVGLAILMVTSMLAMASAAAATSSAPESSPAVETGFDVGTSSATDDGSTATDGGTSAATDGGSAASSQDGNATACDADIEGEGGSNPDELRGTVSLEGDRCASTTVEVRGAGGMVIPYPEIVEGDADLDVFVTLDGRTPTPDDHDRHLTRERRGLVLSGSDLTDGLSLGVSVYAYQGEATFEMSLVYDVDSPEAAITYESVRSASAGVRPNERVTFDASRSMVPNASVTTGKTTYEWSVLEGDAVVAEGTGPNLTAQFDDTGEYEVRLRVEGPRGYADTTTESVSVAGRRAPDIVVRPTYFADEDTIYLREEVTFAVDIPRTTYSNVGEIQQVEWEFPDGTTATGHSVDYAFEESGRQFVTTTVTAEDENNRTYQESKILTLSVVEPSLRVYDVEQRTPGAHRFAARAFGCDAFGVIDIGVTGTELNDSQVRVSVEGVDGWVETRRVSDEGDAAVHRVTAAELYHELPAFEMDRGLQRTLVIEASNANDEHTTTFKPTAWTLPNVVETLMGGPGEPKNLDEFREILAPNRGPEECEIAASVPLIGSPPGAYWDGADDLDTGSSIQEQYDSLTTPGPGGDNALISVGDIVNIEIGNIGPILPLPGPTGPPMVDNWEAGIGGRAQFHSPVDTGAVEGARGSLETGFLGYGQIAMSNPQFRGQINVLGQFDLLHAVGESYDLHPEALRGTLTARGRIDVFPWVRTSVGLPPIPEFIAGPAIGWADFLQIWVGTGSSIRVTKGANSDGLGSIGFDDMTFEWKGNPILDVVGVLGTDDIPRCGSCSLIFRAGGSLDTDFLKLYPEIDDEVTLATGLSMQVRACAEKIIKICPVGMTKSWDLWEATIGLPHLAPAGATTMSSRAGGHAAVATGSRYRVDTETEEIETSERSEASPAASLFGDEEAE